MAIDNNSTIVDIVNAFQNLVVVSGIDDVKNAVGSPVTITSTGDDIASTIQSAKDTLVTKLGTLGISASNTDTLNNLANKVVKDANLVAGNILTGKTIFGVAGSAKQAATGNTLIVDSSHPTINAQIDFASIRVEFYSRIFPGVTGNIQILKNGSTDVANGVTINTTNTANATDIESVYIDINEAFYPGTLYKVMFPAGSLIDKLGNNFAAMEYDFTTAASPSAWANSPNVLAQKRYAPGAVGTQTAALCYAGDIDTSTGKTTSTEEFNGTTWAAGGAVVAAYANPASTGTQNATLSFGGGNWAYYYTGGAGTNKVYTYNGSTWATSAATLTYSRAGLGGGGDQSAAFAAGGESLNSANNSDGYVYNEIWNGTTWATSGSLIQKRSNMGSGGTVNAGIVNAGSYVGGSGGTYLLNSTEKFNGATWSTSANLTTYRFRCGGCGDQGASMIFGGITCPTSSGTLTTVASAEKFNGAAWSNTGSMTTPRYSIAGCGTQTTSALSFAGRDATNTSGMATTEKFFG